jgi:hypothetical protein
MPHRKGGTSVKNIVIAIVTLGIFSILSVGLVSAQTYQTAPQPSTQQTTAPAPAGTPGPYANVKDLKPFSAETSYMSLAGYLRYVTHQKTSQWLTRLEAERIVRQ